MAISGHLTIDGREISMTPWEYEPPHLLGATLCAHGLGELMANGNHQKPLGAIDEPLFHNENAMNQH